MSQRLVYNMKVNAARLSTELIAAFPALAPVPVTWAGGTVPESLFMLEYTDSSVTITVSTAVDPNAVAAVVAKHNPTPDPPPQTRLQWRAALKTQLGGVSTLADVKTIIAALIDGV